MNNFTITEMPEAYLIYGLANRNTKEPVYREFPK